jgi:hypothetical protein
MQKITVCDILRDYGSQYIQTNNIKGQQKGLIKLLSNCQTSSMGTHYRRCDNCLHIDKVNNSCRNRHCPNCQNKDRQEWLDKRMQELLDVGYYHLVFTIPHELNALCLHNKKVMYDILFKASSQTILELSKDVTHLGADTGLITVLHTWGQNLKEHPHLHCIMPAGGLSFDKTHWVHTPRKNNFFIYYEIISKKFRGKFLDLLQIAHKNGNLSIKGIAKDICGKTSFKTLTRSLYKKGWVVNIQKPFAHPEKVLEYLSRYVFRIAISDKRIERIENGLVYFSIKDNKQKGIFRTIKLTINEFIRRFLLHLLPKGFFKVRYYGIFANVHRTSNIAKAKAYLFQEHQDQKLEAKEDGIQTWEKRDTIWVEIMDQVKTAINCNCPVCKKGRMCFYMPVINTVTIVPLE